MPSQVKCVASVEVTIISFCGKFRGHYVQNFRRRYTIAYYANATHALTVVWPLNCMRRAHFSCRLGAAQLSPVRLCLCLYLCLSALQLYALYAFIAHFIAPPLTFSWGNHIAVQRRLPKEIGRSAVASWRCRVFVRKLKKCKNKKQKHIKCACLVAQ